MTDEQYEKLRIQLRDLYRDHTEILQRLNRVDVEISKLNQHAGWTPGADLGTDDSRDPAPVPGTPKATKELGRVEAGRQAAMRDAISEFLSCVTPSGTDQTFAKYRFNRLLERLADCNVSGLPRRHP